MSIVWRKGSFVWAFLVILLAGCGQSEADCDSDSDCKSGEICLEGICVDAGTGGTAGHGGTGGSGGTGGVDCSAICKENASCLPDPATSYCCTCPEDTLCSATMGICVFDEGTGGTGPGGAGGQGTGGSGGEGTGGSGGEGTGGSGGQGTGGSGGEGTGGSGGEGTGGSGGEGTGGAGGGSGGTGGGDPVDCESLCADMAACSSGDQSAVFSGCLLECEFEWDPPTMVCVQDALATCDLQEVNACFPGDPSCKAACTNVYYGCGKVLMDPRGFGWEWTRSDCVMACEDFPGVIDTACLGSSQCGDLGACPNPPMTPCMSVCSEVAACTSGEPGEIGFLCQIECGSWWEEPIRSCLSSAASSCDVTTVAACFPGSSICEEACTNVFYACGEWSTLQVGFDRHDCVDACEVGFLPFDPSCLASAACEDIWDCPTVEVPTCESVCGEVATCGSGDPIAIEALCMEDCTFDWSAPSFACVNGVASTCDVPSIAACFPEDSLCEEVCTKAYFDCGETLTDVFGFELSRSNCALLCDHNLLGADVSCLAAAQCADIASCVLTPPSCEDACDHIYGECGGILHTPWGGPWAGADCVSNCTDELFPWEIHCLTQVSCAAYQSDPDQCWDF